MEDKLQEIFDAHARGEHFSWSNCPLCWAQRQIREMLSAPMISSIVLVTLLSCGVVEAIEPNPKLWYVDPQLGVMFTSPCELKMKEAMQLAEKYKGDLWSPFKMTAYSYSGYYPSTERCVTSACLQKELDEVKAKEKQEEEREKAREKWRAVYKECVQ